MYKTLLTIVCCFTLLGADTHAQTWQWGKRGGSVQTQGATPETTFDIATDGNNNVYALSCAYNTSRDIDGIPLASFGYDIILSSFSCNGAYRWSRIIGPVYEISARAILKADTLGGVYVAVYNNSTVTLNIDTDTTIPTTKAAVLMKYDTLGVLQWVRTPEDVNTYARPLDMDVNATGDIHLLVRSGPGTFANNSYTAPDTGLYVLRYNASGSFISGAKLEMQVKYAAVEMVRMCRDDVNNGYYVAGSSPGPNSVFFNNVPFTHSIYVSSFGHQGQFQWMREDSGTVNRISYSPVVDDSGNVFVTGFVTNGTTFGNYTFTGWGVLGPMVISLDKNGITRWVRYADANAANVTYDIAYNKGELAVVGTYHGTVRWQGYYGKHPQQADISDFDVFIARIGSGNGQVIRVDTIESSEHGHDEPACVAVSRDGYATYIGGRFEEEMYVRNSTLVNQPGLNDFFIAKYGYKCNCTPAEAAFSYSSGQLAVSFTYTGTTQFDSLRWDFGDGTSSWALNPVHTFAGVGAYYVCVTVYNNCGETIYCQLVIPTLGLSSLVEEEGLQVYPNPARDKISVSVDAYGKADMQLQLFNNLGQKVNSWAIPGNGKAYIDISDLPAGLYIYKLAGDKGRPAVGKLNVLR